jgi:subtilisin family serine protease
VFDRAVDIGVVVVLSAGNNGPGLGTIGTPAVARKVIAVAAVEKRSGEIPDYSSRGPVEWTDSDGIFHHLDKPDITGPSGPGDNSLDDICTTRTQFLITNFWDCLDNTHKTFSGTSAATPHVAGAAALILQQHPDWTPEEVKEALMNSAFDLGAPYGIYDQGAGQVDSLAAFNLQES